MMIMSPTPSATESHMTLIHMRSLSFFAWMMAPVRPKSRTRSATPTIAVTIATRPKSAGDSMRASTTVDATWISVLPPNPPIVTNTPRDDVWASLSVGGALMRSPGSCRRAPIPLPFDRR